MSTSATQRRARHAVSLDMSAKSSASMLFRAMVDLLISTSLVVEKGSSIPLDQHALLSTPWLNRDLSVVCAMAWEGVPSMLRANRYTIPLVSILAFAPFHRPVLSQLLRCAALGPTLQPRLWPPSHSWLPPVLCICVWISCSRTPFSCS
jgi:hypothetical protein